LGNGYQYVQHKISGAKNWDPAVNIRATGGSKKTNKPTKKTQSCRTKGGNEKKKGVPKWVKKGDTMTGNRADACDSGGGGSRAN